MSPLSSSLGTLGCELAIAALTSFRGCDISCTTNTYDQSIWVRVWTWDLRICTRTCGAVYGYTLANPSAFMDLLGCTYILYLWSCLWIYTTELSYGLCRSVWQHIRTVWTRVARYPVFQGSSHISAPISRLPERSYPGDEISRISIRNCQSPVTTHGDTLYGPCIVSRAYMASMQFMHNSIVYYIVQHTVLLRTLRRVVPILKLQ